MRNPALMQPGMVAISGAYNDVIHHRIYFGTQGNGASIIPAGDNIRIWANGVGQQEQNISTQSLITLKECDTSLTGENGIIPNGQNFWITAIGIHVEISNVQPTTAFTDNSVSAIDVTPVVRGSAIPLQQALKSQTVFELYRNADERLERGVLDEYPCPFGSQAAFGGGQASVPLVADGGAQAAYTQNSVGIIGTNGMVFRPLSVFHKLDALDQFYGILRVSRAIDLADTLLTGWIDFYLVGLVNIDFKAQQFAQNFG